MSPSIVGWSHTPFGRLDGRDTESLVAEVTRNALDHAGIGGQDIDAVYVANYNGGLVPESFIASLPMQADAGLRFKPATRLENACASGSAAVHAALDAIEAKRARTCLVIGVEKMTAAPGPVVTDALARASYLSEEFAHGMSFPGLFGMIAGEYARRYGDCAAVLARIAAKNHANGVRNPYAQMRRDLGFDFCNTVSDKNPIIAHPLRKTDCSLVSDGAAALVITGEDAGFPRAVGFRARVQVNDFLPMSRRDPVAFEGPKRAWAKALELARLSVHDLSFAEVHDCFTIAELLSYEAMGLAETGQGSRVIDSGMSCLDGALPINPSGGLKAKGHPVGATGVSMHVLAAMQLLGEAGDFQVGGAQLGGVFNMGGSAVANYVSILEPLRGGRR